MSSVLLRTGSGTINSSLLPGAPRFTIPQRHDSFSSWEKYEFSSLLHLELNNNNHRGRISRAISEPQALIRLKSMIISRSGSQSTFPNMLPEVDEDYHSFSDEDVVSDTSSSVTSFEFAKKCFDSGNGRDGFGGSDNNNEQKKIGAHYQKMLKSNPNDPLILRNYGKFLHEVEGDSVKAEECYGRAILASPGDGELLSLYGKLIWETQRDGERAQSYFDQAVVASPHDCMVMGAYAQFMWEAEDDEEQDLGSNKVLVPGAVAVF
uniref:uncharacterized protein LOC122579931 n=1 Tax=Erigeron canadensis TaxID=72917 RepID=UPI001CB8FF2A|nr:uncharacterized protein LOC122579931 [Erigeron canadensis]